MSLPVAVSRSLSRPVLGFSGSRSLVPGVLSEVLGGVLFSFPGRSCPAGLVPVAESRSAFGGFGSGSWSSASLAVGLGVPVCLWLPEPLSVPGSWGFVPVGGGWWVSLPF